MAKRKLEKLKEQLQKQTNPQVRGVGTKHPASIELTYYRALKKLTEKIIKLTEKKLYPAIEKEEKFFIKDEDPRTALLRTITGLRSQADEMAELHFKYATQMADDTNKFNRKTFVKEINKAIGIDVNSILTDEKTNVALRSAVDTNVNLIKTIPEKHFDRVQKALLQGVDEGKSFFSIKKDLYEIGGISKRRARLIARDQVSKLNSKLDRIRQQDLGVEEYYWRTAQDENVRKEPLSHEANEGKLFRWDSPPETGHPGEAVNCRCTADPNLKGFLDRLK